MLEILDISAQTRLTNTIKPTEVSISISEELTFLVIQI
jgi:hypothetical protein